MKLIDVVMVRIYIMESSHLLKEIMRYLQQEAQVRGVTVFRGISGYGGTGAHTAALIDMSLDLPLVIEFFDSKQQIEPALAHLSTLIKSEHIVCWDVKANL